MFLLLTISNLLHQQSTFHNLRLKTFFFQQTKYTLYTLQVSRFVCANNIFDISIRSIGFMYCKKDWYNPSSEEASVPLFRKLHILLVYDRNSLLICVTIHKYMFLPLTLPSSFSNFFKCLLIPDGLTIFMFLFSQNQTWPVFPQIFLCILLNHV